MRQRVMIAMAMANDPEVIIAGEPTTALDVTVQAQILETLRRLTEETAVAVVLITHDLGVMANMADRVVVMYAGRLVEEGSVDDIFDRPRMPYTVGLLGSMPRLDGGDVARLTPIGGDPAVDGGAAPGLPLRPPLPAGLRPLRGGGAGPGADRASRAPDRLPLLDRAHRTPGHGAVRGGGRSRRAPPCPLRRGPDRGAGRHCSRCGTWSSGSRCAAAGCWAGPWARSRR
ncbi:MAG: hypothetical protein ACRDZ9_06875 [Acidimicrobiales bacterium]